MREIRRGDGIVRDIRDNFPIEPLPYDVLLWSGGPDALMAYFALAQRGSEETIRLLFVDLGHGEIELQSADRLASMIGKADEMVADYSLSDFVKWEVGGGTALPLRNLLMAMVASYYGDRIWMGIGREQSAHDKRQDVLRRLATVISDCYPDTSAKSKTSWCKGRKITIGSPIFHWTKSQGLQWFLNTIENAQELWLTSRSCFSSELWQCGDCTSCLQRALAELEILGKVITEYEVDPRQTERAREWVRRAKAGLVKPVDLRPILDHLA
jgi:7-cyano-7-deazaguanine synthase in queuosine biosynthesis